MSASSDRLLYTSLFPHPWEEVSATSFSPCSHVSGLACIRGTEGIVAPEEAVRGPIFFFVSTAGWSLILLPAIVILELICYSVDEP